MNESVSVMLFHRDDEEEEKEVPLGPYIYVQNELSHEGIAIQKAKEVERRLRRLRVEAYWLLGDGPTAQNLVSHPSSPEVFQCLPAPLGPR
jgi:hypothetical protein